MLQGLESGSHLTAGGPGSTIDPDRCQSDKKKKRVRSLERPGARRRSAENWLAMQDAHVPWVARENLDLARVQPLELVSA